MLTVTCCVTTGISSIRALQPTTRAIATPRHTIDSTQRATCSTATIFTANYRFTSRQTQCIHSMGSKPCGCPFGARIARPVRATVLARASCDEAWNRDEMPLLKERIQALKVVERERYTTAMHPGIQAHAPRCVRLDRLCPLLSNLEGARVGKL